MDILSLIIKIIMCVFSIFLIVVVLLQSGNKTGLSGTFGGSEAIVGKSKARGFEKLLSTLTLISAAGFGVLAVVLTILARFA